jgi:hypothetical protein
MDEGVQGEGDRSNRRARWLGVLLIVVAIGAVGVQAWRVGEVEPAAGVASGGSLARPSLSEMLADAGAMRSDSLAQAASLPPDGAASAPLAEGEAEVCGHGRVRLDSPEMARLEQAVAQLRRELSDALAASADEVDRAIGLLTREMARPTAVSIPASGAEVRAGDEQAVDRLARMAVGSRSSPVYALALMACDRGGRRGACQMLSVEQWARLDPGNAAPWMRMLSEASNRRDDAALDEALFQISRATSYDDFSSVPLKQVIVRLPADAPLFERFGVMADLFAMSVASPAQFAAYGALHKHCDAQAVVDANRRQACAAVAEALVPRSRSLMDFRAALIVGEQGGWPAERVQALRDEGDAAWQWVTESAARPGDFSCGFLAREQARIAEMSRAGEWPVLSRRIRSAPEGVAELARRYRESKAKAQKAMAAASAAAVR